MNVLSDVHWCLITCLWGVSHWNALQVVFDWQHLQAGSGSSILSGLFHPLTNQGLLQLVLLA